MGAPLPLPFLPTFSSPPSPSPAFSPSPSFSFLPSSLAVSFFPLCSPFPHRPLSLPSRFSHRRPPLPVPFLPPSLPFPLHPLPSRKHIVTDRPEGAERGGGAFPLLSRMEHMQGGGGREDGRWGSGRREGTRKCVTGCLHPLPHHTLPVGPARSLPCARYTCAYTYTHDRRGDNDQFCSFISHG